MKDLKKKYESVCNEYVKIFCEKNDLEFEGWVGDIVGGVAFCSDFVFNFHDIVWDVNSEQPKGTILNWYCENLESPEKSINYYSYTKGLSVNSV